MGSRYIGIDFDGSCVTHEYPYVGRDIGAQEVLKKLVKEGHKLILFTMRSGKELKDAEMWFIRNGISLYGINRNPTQTWTTSPKAYAHHYIDDAAMGCPVINNGKDRAFIDWVKMEELLIDKGILPYTKIIDVQTFKEIFLEATTDLMNVEEAVDVYITEKDGITRIDYNIDTGRRGTMTYDESYVTIENSKVHCETCEFMEGCGIEEMVEEKIKEYINGK